MFQGVFAWIIEKSIFHSVTQIHIEYSMQIFVYFCVYKNAMYEFPMYHGRIKWSLQDTLVTKKEFSGNNCH